MTLYKHEQVIYFQYTVAPREDWEAGKERLDQCQTEKVLNYIVLCLDTGHMMTSFEIQGAGATPPQQPAVHMGSFWGASNYCL